MSTETTITPINDAPPDMNAGRLADRLANSIDFDLELDGSVDIEPEATNDLDEGDFDEPAEDAIEDEDTKREKKPKPKEEPAKPKPVVPPAAKDEPKPEPVAAKPILPADKGTEDKPYGVNDLPGDKFLKLKIDGKETVLPLREIADGYIRKQTFDVTLSKANQAIKDAQAQAGRAKAFRERLVQDTEGFLGSDERIFNVLLERDPDLLMRLGSRIGNLYGEWSKDPAARQRYDYERQQRQIAVERQRVQQERQQLEQEKQRGQASEQARRTWQPIYQEAMKEAGFPKATPEFQRTLKTLMRVTEEDKGGKITPDEFKACVKQAAKLTGAETVDARTPPAAPVVERKPAPRSSSNGKADKWAGMTHAQKMRDPNYLLR